MSGDELTEGLKQVQTVDEKKRLAEKLLGLLSGDRVELLCSDQKTRTAKVQRECEGYDDTPDWTGFCVAEDETGYILDGHGTEYLLTVSEDSQPLLPKLQFPSQDPPGLLVLGAQSVEKVDERIVAEETAGDLLWRVDRYGGR